jgi:uncharacterized protein (DUF1810 family)
MTSTSINLERFVEAQASVYDTARRELSEGLKTSHWMWFVFPQLRVLGKSATAKFFGLVNQAEAAAYFNHPLLGARLKECARLTLANRGKSAHDIFGSPDDLKLCSSMTLFEFVAPDEPVFAQVLEQYYGGERDQLTLNAVSR